MNNNLFASIGFSVCSLFFAIFILLMYINKKKYKNIENTLFISLLILLFVLVFVEITYVLLLYIGNINILTRFVCRLYLNLIIVWMLIFTYYILVLATRKIEDKDEKKKKRKNIAIAFGVFGLIALISSNLLPLEFYDYTKKLYTFGGSASIVAYVIAGVALFSMIYSFIIKRDLVDSNQRKPIVYTVVLILVITLVQFFIPEADYNIQNFQYTLLLMTLFFTLESQDNKLLVEHEKSKEEAEKANAEQTEFLTSMSHEIRTPMSVIMGFSDSIMREKELTKEIVNNDTTNIHTAAVNLLELINNILDLSRMQSGKEQIIEKEYDTQNLLVEINDLMLSKINSKYVRFQIITDENLPQKLQGDYTKVLKVLSNTLINVLNYTKRGGITFKVGFTKRENSFMLLSSIETENSEIDEDEYNTYYVNDNNDLDNRVNNVVLGINVAKMYASMLQGRVIMTSNDRYNISYYVELEQTVINPNPIGNISSLFVPKNENDLLNLEGKTVLVVDDNQLNIKLIKRLLVDYNLKVEAASSGLECIDKVKQTDYDAIFLDHMMPGMDGIETLHELKNLKSNIPPTIALTANSYTGVKETYINAGFTDYLAKPINKNELNKLLNSIFNK